MTAPYDAILILSFGGPERREDVIPFLENVLRGKPVPRERMMEVAQHYYHFGGRSPLNEQNRALAAALQRELAQHGLPRPVYWGNRNWHPYLTDAVREMAAAGVRRALAFATSAFSSYSGCRQYLDNIAAARAEVGPAAPTIEKIRAFFNHPTFLEAMTDQVRSALAEIPPERRGAAHLFFTAHSIPTAMAATCAYVAELEEASRLVAEAAGHARWRLVYQSRGGPPAQPWLEPDVLDALDEVRAAGGRDVVLAPIGFLSDHMEVIYDLDTEARAACETLGLAMVRAATVGGHPRYVSLVRELIEERVKGLPPRAVGRLPAAPDVCAPECCAYSPRRTASPE